MLLAQPCTPDSVLSGLIAAGSISGREPPHRTAPPRTAPAVSHAAGWVLPAPRQPGWDGNGKHRQSELRHAELTERGSWEQSLRAANWVTE